MEQSYSICCQLKWSKWKTQMPSKLWQRIGYGITYLHIDHHYIFINMLFRYCCPLKSINVLRIIANKRNETKNLHMSRNCSCIKHFWFTRVAQEYCATKKKFCSVPVIDLWNMEPLHWRFWLTDIKSILNYQGSNLDSFRINSGHSPILQTNNC